MWNPDASLFEKTLRIVLISSDYGSRKKLKPWNGKRSKIFFSVRYL